MVVFQLFLKDSFPGAFSIFVRVIGLFCDFGHCYKLGIIFLKVVKQILVNSQ